MFKKISCVLFLLALPLPLLAECPLQFNGYQSLGTFNTSTYFLSEDKLKYVDATVQATAVNGNLVIINNEQENEFLRQHITEIVLIGFNDADTENTFIWPNSTPVTFNNLAEDNTADRDYANMNFWNGEWGLDSYWTARKYLVEISCNAPIELLADLALKGQFHRPSTRQLSTFELTVDVQNIGDAAVEQDFNIDAWLSADDQIGPDDLKLHTWRITDDWRPVLSRRFEADVNVPLELPAQQYRVIVQVDPDSVVDEKSESNNIGTSLIEVTPKPNIGNCPDDIDDHFNLGMFNDHNYYLSNTERNWGWARHFADLVDGHLASITSDAENEFLKNNIDEIVFIGLSDAFGEGVFTWENGEQLTISNLEQENSFEKDYVNMNFWNGNWGLDSQLVKRKYIVEIDCDSETSAIGPDLISKEVIVPASAMPGEEVEVLLKFSNIGNEIVTGNATLALFLSEDQILDDDDILLRSTVITQVLINRDNGWSPSLFVPTNTPDGDYFILGVSDYLDFIDELDESNNIATAPLVVQQTNVDGVDLEVNVEVDSNQFAPFNYYTFTVTVTNTGTLSATNVNIKFNASQNLRVSDVSVNKGETLGWNYFWDNFDLAAGESAEMQIVYFSLRSDDTESLLAQVYRVDQSDLDSEPDNYDFATGVISEDDEDRAEISLN